MALATIESHFSEVNTEPVRPQPTLLELVRAERQELGSASTYDRFLYELVGDPEQEDGKPVRFPSGVNEEVYRYRNAQMVTATSIAVLRSTEPLRPRPEKMMVVYADLFSRRYGALAVQSVLYGDDYHRSLTLELVEAPDVEVSPEVMSIGDLRRVSGEPLASMQFGIDRAGFTKPGGEFELCAGSLQQLHRALQQMPRQDAHQVILVA